MSSGVDFRDYDDSGNLISFMCCICFDSVRADSAWVCPHGDKWDSCIPCGEKQGCAHLCHE